jgi:hypothetical protein
MISFRNPWIRPKFIKNIKIDIFQKFLDENIQTRNKYKVHDREISSHLFNILNVWSIHILHIFMLQRFIYTHVDIILKDYLPYCTVRSFWPMSYICTFPRYKAVMDLVAPHFGKNHHVTMDNWFTSPKLLQDLIDWLID